MIIHHPARPAPATPMHEFLVLCVRPEAVPPLEPATDFSADRAPRPALADVDGMFWRPAQFGDDAA